MTMLQKFGIFLAVLAISNGQFVDHREIVKDLRNPDYEAVVGGRFVFHRKDDFSACPH